MLLAGEIGEAQWLATIALALLHEEYAAVPAVAEGVAVLRANAGLGLLGVVKGASAKVLSDGRNSSSR